MHIGLGAAFESADDFGAAIGSYRRALALGDDEAEPLLRWAAERLEARSLAVAVAQETLERYAGVYRERVVTLRDGRLYYEGGSKPRSPLRPMTDDLFELEVDPTIRVRFSRDGVGGTAKLVEIWNDGSAEDFQRTGGGTSP